LREEGPARLLAVASGEGSGLGGALRADVLEPAAALGGALAEEGRFRAEARRLASARAWRGGRLEYFLPDVADKAELIMRATELDGSEGVRLEALLFAVAGAGPTADFLFQVPESFLGEGVLEPGSRTGLDAAVLEPAKDLLAVAPGFEAGRLPPAAPPLSPPPLLPVAINPASSFARA
jgi:hypothetical protein